MRRRCSMKTRRGSRHRARLEPPRAAERLTHAFIRRPDRRVSRHGVRRIARSRKRPRADRVRRPARRFVGEFAFADRARRSARADWLSRLHDLPDDPLRDIRRAARPRAWHSVGPAWPSRSSKTGQMWPHDSLRSTWTPGPGRRILVYSCTVLKPDRGARPTPPPARLASRARLHHRGRRHAPTSARDRRVGCTSTVRLGQARTGVAATCATSCPRRSRTPCARHAGRGGRVSAAAAFEGYAAWLEELPAARATGRSATSATPRCCARKSCSGTTPRRCASAARQRVRATGRRAARVRARSTGTDDWPSVLRRLNDDHPRRPRRCATAYAEWTERARAFLRGARAGVVPAGEECPVVPSPPFQRPCWRSRRTSRRPRSAAGCTATSSCRSRRTAPPRRRSSKRLAEQQLRVDPDDLGARGLSGPPLAPGHAPRATRRAFAARFRTSYFTEGWGLYAEQMMREQGFFTDPRHEMCQLEAMLFRAARIVVDTSLHIGDMCSTRPCTFMTTKDGLPEPTARAEVARYCAWPTQAAPISPAASRSCASATATSPAPCGRPRFGAGVQRHHPPGSGMLPIALAERAVMATASRAAAPIGS